MGSLRQSRLDNRTTLETIVCLSKLPDTTVEVEIDMEELEVTAG